MHLFGRGIHLNFVFPSSLTVVLAVFLYLGHYKKFCDDDDDDDDDDIDSLPSKSI